MTPSFCQLIFYFNTFIYPFRQYKILNIAKSAIILLTIANIASKIDPLHHWKQKIQKGGNARTSIPAPRSLDAFSFRHHGIDTHEQINVCTT